MCINKEERLAWGKQSRAPESTRLQANPLMVLNVLFLDL